VSKTVRLKAIKVKRESEKECGAKRPLAIEVKKGVRKGRGGGEGGPNKKVEAHSGFL